LIEKAGEATYCKKIGISGFSSVYYEKVK